MAANNTARDNRREVFLTENVAAALEERKKETGISAAIQIRQAVQRYLQIPHDRLHRLLVTEREIRKPANIPDELWNELKARKADTGLDLNEQVQIAVALYLQESDTPPDLTLTPPEPKPKAGKAEKSTPLPIDRDVYRDVLREELAKMGAEAYGATPAILQTTVTVPATMIIDCGPGDGVDNIVVPVVDGGTVEVTGALAKLVTEHSSVAKANGWSMSQDNLPEDIKPGDWLLMTPFSEYTGGLREGLVVLARIVYADGRDVLTLKSLAGGKLKANNPVFKGVDFRKDKTISDVSVFAVCRGVLEKVFG